MVNYVGPSELAKEAAELYDILAHKLGGRHPFVQGAVLADLVALWIAGHFAPDIKENAKIRDHILEEHIKLVQQLIPYNENLILKRLTEALPKH